MSVVFAKIQMRRGTAAEWSAANPVLAQGEIAFETDTRVTKIGDGATGYLDLPSYATHDQMVAAMAEITETLAEAETQAGLASGHRVNAEAARDAALASQNIATQQANVAQAQASLAAGHAASAASVVQQDLAGIAAQALHRSPNAVTAMFIYDTSKDSDGGAWTKKCQNTSWYNEPIFGAWLGAWDNELQARSAGGTRGAELVTDSTARDFASDSGWWTRGTGVSIANNGCSFASVASGAGLSRATLVTIGRLYAVTFDITSYTSGGIRAVMTANGVTRQGTGRFTDYFVATGTTLALQATAAGTTLTIDNVSVREVTALNTAAADYFQRSTDGLFFALSKNRLTSTATLATQTQWLTAGTYTLSSTTGSTGSVAVSGAATASHTAGGSATTFVVATSGNVTFTVTGSVTTAQCELGASATSYAANGTISASEIFRGNKRDFPKLAAIVAEASSVTIYDLTEPGRPMWMRFVSVASDSVLSFLSHQSSPVSCVAALNGVIAVGKTGAAQFYGHLRVANFAADQMRKWSGYYNTNHISLVGIAQRNSTSVGFGVTGDSVTPGLNSSSGSINAVAMVILPDAPVDPVTGLRVPTIAVATAGGISVIRHTGAVETKAYFSAVCSSVAFDGSCLIVGGVSPNSYWGCFVWDLRDGSVREYGRYGFGGVVTPLINNVSNPQVRRIGEEYAGIQGAGVNLLRNNNSSSVKALLSRITPIFNTGWMIGDVRRCFLSDTEVGTLTGSVADRSFRGASAAITGTLTRAQLASGTSLVGYSGFSASNYLQEAFSADLDFGTGEWTASAWVNIPTGNAAAGTILARAFSSGASITLGINASNNVTATAFDGTTTRTVTSSLAYNSAQWIKVRVSYTTDGSLVLTVNGVQVAATRGSPLLTLNNASAVLTIGNSLALDAPFFGSIALLKIGATVPAAEQAVFMFEQEKHLFRAGAFSVLPDSGAIADMAHDDATDRWIAVSAANESYWTGLVRNLVLAVPAGSFSRVAAGSGLELAARTGTNPGVDVTIPAYGLREELVRRAEAAARLSKELSIHDYVGGFTASTTNGSTAITSVAGLTYPVSYIGARISGSGIPSNTAIVAVSGTTIYLSAAATATATGVSVSFLDFRLPVGMEAKAVMSAGALRQEGATKDFTRLHDGFIETVRFGVAPGATAWVQIQATRGAVQ